MAALAALFSGCGLTVRLSVGPTLDQHGRVGAELRISQGPKFELAQGPSSHGIATVASLGGTLQPGGPGWDVAAGPEAWVAKENGFQLRAGPFAGYARHGDSGRPTVGVSAGAATHVARLRRASLALGAEARCGLRLSPVGAPADTGRCGLGLSLEIDNTRAVDLSEGPIR
jgi:hypothetical protein